jgi:hypothetical protein
MTTFATQVGFNSTAPNLLETYSYFELLRGFNSASPNRLLTSYFSLLRGLNSASPSSAVSIGRVEFPSGTFYPQDGVATIVNNVTNESYTVPLIDGYFPIYSYLDEFDAPVEMIVGARVGTKRGAIVITITTPGIYTVVLSESLSIATKATALSLTRVNEVNTNDFLYQGECCYTEPVFALPLAEWWKNDKSSFLQKKLTALDTIEFKLFKNGLEVAILDNDYLGEYYSFTLYTGFVLYWENVYSNYGTGSYQVKAFEVLGGLPVQWDSQEFCLDTYSDLKADGTFRIETYQTGSILRSGFNYDELNLTRGWYQSYRLKGILGNKKATLESDYLMTSDRRMLQIQDKVSYEYELQTNLLPAAVAKVLIEDNLIANEILLTDFNLYNTDIFRRVELYPTSINDTKSFSGNRKVIYSIIFKERVDNILKRN